MTGHVSTRDHGGRRTGRTGRRVASGIVVSAMLPVLGAGLIGSTAAGASQRPHAGAPISVGIIGPMTGPAAEIGVLMTGACTAAVKVVNAGGGALGHPLKCDQIDDVGDAADAVPNVSRALATTSNLDMAVGLESNTAATTVPIVNDAHIPMFSTDGLVAFDKNNYPYFWRTTPADNQNGAAFAAWAVKKGWTKVAMLIQNNIGSQGNEPGIVQGIDHSHGKIVLNVTIPGDAASYSSVVERAIAAHPQAIIASTDPQTAATFFSEYKQLNNGKVPPIVTATDSLTPDYFSALVKVLGASYVSKNIALVGSFIDQKTMAYRLYRNAIYGSPSIKSPATVLGVGVISSIYDGIISMSLAMQMAHSTSGPAYNADILKVTTARAGAVVVNTYKAGLAALKAGKQIDYVGVGGQFVFNKYHNSPGNFSASAFNPDGSVRTLGTVSGATVLSILGG